MIGIVGEVLSIFFFFFLPMEQWHTRGGWKYSARRELRFARPLNNVAMVGGGSLVTQVDILGRAAFRGNDNAVTSGDTIVSNCENVTRN